MNEPPQVKQVIVVRKDLNMRKGKIASQTAHASMGVLLQCLTVTEQGHVSGHVNKDFVQWAGYGPFTKIVLSCGSERELLDIYQRAKASGLPTSLITDAGKTEFKGVPTLTCCAIGPAVAERIDTITKHLSLL